MSFPDMAQMSQMNCNAQKAQNAFGANISTQAMTSSGSGGGGGSATPNSLANCQQQNNQQKRARTRITDDQLGILRLYFDINNSPTEEQIDEMSRKAGLPHKVREKYGKH